MGLFDIFKKKKCKKEEVEFVSYSHTTEDGQFMESYGYSVNNSAEEFFNNLSIEELDEIREPKLKELISKTNLCARCHKEIHTHQLTEEHNRCLCSNCVESIKILSKQKDEVEEIINEYISSNKVRLTTSFVEKIKKKVEQFLTEYNNNEKSYYVFYWSEYPMGAIHNKVLMKLESTWYIIHDDYDEKPREKRTPYPQITDENLARYLVKFIIDEGK